MNRIKLAAAILLSSSAVAANATVITLNFEGIAPFPNNSNVLIEGYYNGGTASNGASGPNYGVGFSAGATVLCLNSTTETCSNTSKGGGGVAGSDKAAMYFPSVNPYMNVAAGFDTGFSMAYTNPFAQSEGIAIYDGLNGTGNLLASLALGPTTNGADGACVAYGSPNYCPFASASIGFIGIAKSVLFTGAANFSTYDDFTFGSTTVGGVPAVPEPESWALMLGGLVVAGIAARKRLRDDTSSACSDIE